MLAQECSQLLERLHAQLGAESAQDQPDVGSQEVLVQADVAQRHIFLQR